MTLSKARMTQYQKERRARLKDSPPDNKVGCLECLMLEAKIKELEAKIKSQEEYPLLQINGVVPRDQYTKEELTLRNPEWKEASSTEEQKNSSAKEVLKKILDNPKPPFALCPKCHIMNERCMCK